MSFRMFLWRNQTALKWWAVVLDALAIAIVVFMILAPESVEAGEDSYIDLKTGQRHSWVTAEGSSYFEPLTVDLKTGQFRSRYVDENLNETGQRGYTRYYYDYDKRTYRDTSGVYCFSLVRGQAPVCVGAGQ